LLFLAHQGYAERSTQCKTARLAVHSTRQLPAAGSTPGLSAPDHPDFPKIFPLRDHVPGAVGFEAEVPVEANGPRVVRRHPQARRTGAQGGFEEPAPQPQPLVRRQQIKSPQFQVPGRRRRSSVHCFPGWHLVDAGESNNSAVVARHPDNRWIG